MADVEYTFVKSPIAVDRLDREIRESAIITALRHVSLLGEDQLTVVMASNLSSDDETTLNAIVAAHTGEVLEHPPPVQQVTLGCEIVVSGPKDSDGSLINRTKTTRTGWHFEPRSLDFWTAQANSLYNRKHDTAGIYTGTSYGDAVLKFYNASNVELVQDIAESVSGFQSRLDTDCVVSVLDWQPTYEMDIIAGTISVRNPPEDPSYMWAIVAPDLPAIYGGSVPFMAGGWNLSFLRDRDYIRFDGRGVKAMAYDPIYKTNKIRLVIKHPPGYQIGLQAVYEHFKA